MVVPFWSSVNKSNTRRHKEQKLFVLVVELELSFLFPHSVLLLLPVMLNICPRSQLPTESGTIAQRKTGTVVEGVVEKASPQLRLLSTIHDSLLFFPFLSFLSPIFFLPSSSFFWFGCAIKNYSYAKSFGRLSASSQPASHGLARPWRRTI